MKTGFPRTFGQEEAKERLRQALDRGRFPHALLVHGEAGLGQHALLLDLAQILVCEDDANRPCGACSSCRAFAAQSLGNVLYLMPLVKKERRSEAAEGERDENQEESLESGQLDELLERIQALYASPYAFVCPDKAMVTVGQTRHLISRLGYAEAGGRPRPVIVPCFEALNPAAANALLKTLEEPPAGVYFLIGSENRAVLLPTLWSRCMHLGLAPLSPEEFHRAAQFLAREAGHNPVSRLEPFAEGSPGTWIGLLEHGGEELLEEALRLLSATSDWRMFAEYATELPSGAEGLARAARLLHFLLRMLRAHQTLKARHPGASRGSADGYRWTAAALEAEGWDTSLAAYLGPCEDLADAGAFAECVEAAHQAVLGYSKPQMALLGAFLDYEAKVARAIPRLAEAPA